MLTRHSIDCDKCNATFSFNGRPFKSVLSDAKAQGWRVVKLPNVNAWRHYCPAHETVQRVVTPPAAPARQWWHD